MTKRKALQILLRHTVTHFEGSGVGLRAVPTETQRREAREAVLRLWRDAYAFAPNDSDLGRLV